MCGFKSNLLPIEIESWVSGSFGNKSSIIFSLKLSLEPRFEQFLKPSVILDFPFLFKENII